MILRLITLLLAFSLTSGSHAETPNEYTAAAKTLEMAVESNNIDKIALATKAFVTIAIDRNRLGVASWKYNNLGYAYFCAFQKKVNYSDTQDTYNGIRPGHDQAQYKRELQSQYKPYVDLLKEGFLCLQEAKALDKRAPSGQRSDLRTRKILNNLTNIKELYKYATDVELSDAITLANR